LLLPKAHITKLNPAVHGGLDYGEIASLGLKPEDVLDFSASLNPFGPPPAARKALTRAVIGAYPDSGSGELTTTLAAMQNIGEDNLLVGAGATELIRLAAICYLGEGDTALIPTPAYGEYEIAARLTGAKVVYQLAAAKDGYRPDITALTKLIAGQKPKVVFLCNPNNPTGVYLESKEVAAIINAAPDSLIVIDEAYIAFTENAWPSAELISHPNTLIIRSLTKDYALAGLRLGYALADSGIINTLRRAKPPWNVTSPAQAAAIAALRDGDYMSRCAAGIREAGNYLIAELGRLGYETLPSATNFFLVRVGDGAKLRQKLLRRGMLVRDGASFGLADCIRLAPRTLPECRRLITALANIKNAR
jgi:histidinol-phosphate aminotransferase